MFAALLVPSTALAGPSPSSNAQTEQVSARLLSSLSAVKAGEDVVLGVQQRILKNWHTYWLNPGDSGVATTIEWALPPGAQAGPVEWATPSRFQVGPIANYGYAEEVTLLSTLRVPASLKAGDRFAVQAKVSWLVCEDSCIPQEVLLALSLPVQASAQPSAAADTDVLQRARERLPVPDDAVRETRWHTDASGLGLQLRQHSGLPTHDAAYFYAADWGRVVHAEPQRLQQSADGGWRLQLVAGEAPPGPTERPRGVLVLSYAGKPVQALALGDVRSGPLLLDGPAPARAPRSSVAADEGASVGLATALGLAFLGGLVLNLMPCVFPVLSIKALSLLQTAQESPRSLRLHGLAYTAGVLLSFLVLAGLLIVLQAGGRSVGWGFQFQSPAFVLVLALLMFAMGLALSGVFTLGASVAGIGSGLAARGGTSGSFFTGVLATVVATPCTAPFMGVAIGYAFTQAPAVALLVFVALGLGLALPYGLLCVWPALQRRLPRPGAWMERLKQALAFPMYGTAAYLVWVVAQQAGASALAVTLAATVLLGFAAWLYEAARQRDGRRGPWLSAGAAALALLAVVGGAWSVEDKASASPGTASRAAVESNGWEPYSPERLTALRAQGKPVFVNVTAAWCITCLANEKVALGVGSVEAAFEAAGITRLKGDWTRRDERITRLLADHGRSGVPLYLLYPPGVDGEAQVLPQLLSPQLVLAAIDAIGTAVGTPTP